MDNLKGVWHAIVYTWPAKLILDKGASDKSIVG